MGYFLNFDENSIEITYGVYYVYVMNNVISRITEAHSLTTLSEKAASQMRQMIVDGELPPGLWLRKRQISKMLNMSPTPIVEALRRLQHDGLVEINPRWGARVKVWTVSEIAQLADMRIALEGTIVRRAAETLDRNQLASLREIAIATDDMDLKFENPSDSAVIGIGEVFQSDLRFHRELARESGLLLIAREIDRLRVLQATCRLLIKPAVRTVVSHQQLIDAIATKDGRLAERAMREHIESNVKHYLPRLRERFGDGPVTWDNEPVKSGESDNDEQESQ